MTGTNKYNECAAIPLSSILTCGGTQTAVVVREITEALILGFFFLDNINVPPGISSSKPFVCFLSNHNSYR